MKPHLSGIFIDNLQNDFAHITGGWPESYIFAGKNGNVYYKSEIIDDEGTIDIQDVWDYANSNKWTNEEDKRRAQRQMALFRKMNNTDEYGLQTKVVS